MIRQTALGPFTWDDPCWISEPTSVPLFGGAKVQVQKFGDRDDTEVLEVDEVDALQRFLALPRERGLEVTPHLWRYYRDVWESVGPSHVPELADPAAIWDHVAPRFVSVAQDEEGASYIVVEAECDWEVEHGLQLVLQKGERWVRVSDYTGHLTDGRAWGEPGLDNWMSDPSKTLPVRSVDELYAAKNPTPATDRKRFFGLRRLADLWTRRR